MNYITTILQEDESNKTFLTLNNGLWINSQQRYKPRFILDTPNSTAKFIPGGAWQKPFYPVYQYHVSQFTWSLGINDISKDGYGLGKVYPNPTNGNAGIEFSVGKPQNVTISVSDLLGRPVMNITNGFYGEGKHTVNFNTETLSPGIYLYTITAGNYSSTKRFVVNR